LAPQLEVAMKPESSSGTELKSNVQKSDTGQSKAVEQLAEAHSLLTTLRKKLGEHPELEEAIQKLEFALSVLTIESGGML
jgi:predicted translin family RNA/ssDNA-binding protein